MPPTYGRKKETMSKEYVTGENFAEAAAPVDDVQPETQVSKEQQETNVPVEALQAERVRRQNLQEENRVLKDHVALMQVQQSKPKEVDAFEGSKDDVLTYGDLEKILAKKEEQYQVSLGELRTMQEHPDYNEVITQYLPEVLKQNPKLCKKLRESQDFEMAYYLAKNSDHYRNASEKKKVNADAKRIVANSQQTGSLASTGSSSPLSQGQRYKDMSDEEFQKFYNSNRGTF